MACDNDILVDGTVTLALPDHGEFRLFGASDVMLDEEGNPILDETACAIQEE